ncbi:TRAP transporter small permease [Oceanibium sediminis]|uniref:TRAP transporter small permease n=1 Tax=Oceanibium sediminis TaxID=2026339 RepID=UPI001E2E00CA|nr:TRAP transporter small permease [Oceanibium sediminis]
MYSILSSFAQALARWMAYAGGAVLLIVVGLTCISIAGRALLPFNLGVGPIKGIYDITEIGMAAAVFAFLPWCQVQRGHAAVDLFEPVFPPLLNRLLDLLFDGAMFAVALVVTYRMYLGMADKMRYGETTQIAQIPVWYGYAASLVGAAAFVLVAAFCVIRAARALVRGKADGAHV